MQILQWTGQPRMALINLIGPPDYLEQWRRALDQYFSIVREFDALHADFEARTNLLRAFAELDEQWRDSMAGAIDALVAERHRRRRSSATEISQGLLDCMGYTFSASLADGESAEAKTSILNESLMTKVKRREQRAREAVQRHYRHEGLDLHEHSLALLQMDLFTGEGWELFGLSKTQLLLSGAMTGAVAGLGVDALVGGASLLLGAGIGAVLGGLGSYFGSDELAKTTVLGAALGGRRVVVGPVVAANFPWVFVGRAWIHHCLIEERNHARRDEMSSNIETRANLMDEVAEDIRKPLANCFAQIKKQGRSAELEANLVEAVCLLLKQAPQHEQDEPG